ncbi:MAG: hypothetical protein KAW92_11900 [Candidatus Cloacimonetes bacterium]|nr:hypothetical protein [Candidatus Cloacimonadota bacterium]
MRPYFRGERPFGGHILSSIPFHRLAVITDVNATKGTVNIKWLDHPSGREDIVISQSAFGSLEFPVPGAVVLIAMQEGDIPEIDRYMSVGYMKQVQVGEAKQIYPGEKLWRSYVGSDVGKDEGHFPTPVPTGSEIYMTKSGKIILRDGTGDWWELDPTDNIIHQNSMVYQCTTEAGILDFGLVKREMPTYPDPAENSEMVLVTRNNTSILNGGQAFTEFRIRVLETADVDPTTAPEVDDPFVEVILGTKIKREGSGLNTTYSPEETTSVHAESGKEICIQIRTKGTVGFEFTVDKEGNVTMRVADDKKLKIKCDDIELGGGGDEKTVVLSDFITTYNGHTHTGAGVGPVDPAHMSTGETSEKVKLE